MSTRVRFAPSPTGPLHIGGVRTALYNYLFAKNTGGTFILRIEDTDTARTVPEAEQYIKDSLSWSGMIPDEGPEQGGAKGPYRQSERKDIYLEHVKMLIENGKAYYAFDSTEELESMRERVKALGVHTPKYDHSIRMEMSNSLTLSEDQVKDRLERGDNYTVRLKVEPGQQISFNDIVRDEVTFSSDELDDKILLKSDGMPTYHLANVVDDRLMNITHVIRGEEWLSSTAHHVLLYRAFGWEERMPQFSHLPLILKPTGKGKLSKRDGQKLGIPVFPMEWKVGDDTFPGFREMGFLPEGMLNFLAMLGWSPGTDEEIFTQAELIQHFSLQQVGKSGARFDFEKAKWVNQQHISICSEETLESALFEQLEKRQIKVDQSHISKYVELFRPRIELLSEIYDVGYYFFEDVKDYNLKIVRKKWKDESAGLFQDIVNQLSTEVNWSPLELKNGLSKLINESGLGFGAILPLIRVALCGDTKGPDLFETIAFLGKEKVISRLKTASDLFSNLK